MDRAESFEIKETRDFLRKDSISKLQELEALLEHIKSSFIFLLKKTPFLPSGSVERLVYDQLLKVTFSLFSLQEREINEINEAREALPVYKVDEKATKK